MASQSHPLVYTPVEAAAILGITKEEVIEQFRQGKLPGFQVGKYAISIRIQASALPKPKKPLPKVDNTKPDISLLRSPEENIFRELHRIQGSTCAICGKPETKQRRLMLDHDHKTGYVRGLLCTRCNTGLGMLQDSPELLLAAARYIGKNTFIRRKLTYTAATYDRMKVAKRQRRRKRSNTPAA